jgi:hypothetical protein
MAAGAAVKVRGGGDCSCVVPVRRSRIHQHFLNRAGVVLGWVVVVVVVGVGEVLVWM